MRIKRFNESKEYHTINPEDIEDYAIEMTDAGFNMTVTKGFICDGKRTKHPVTDTSIPYYNIEFSIEEGQLESDPERWNGSYYLADRDFLKMFLHFVTRMELYGRSFWYISNNRYTCNVWLKGTETEIEFDWDVFSDKMEKKVNSVDDRDFEISDHWMGGGRHGVGFKSRLINERTYLELMSKSDTDQDNKKDYDVLKKEWEDFLSEYKYHVTCKISYNLERVYEYPKKMGFLKKDKILKFSFYTLQIVCIKAS
jgi:hypothetical protein